MDKYRRKTRWWLGITGLSVIFLTGIYLLSKREEILHNTINRAIQRFRTEDHVRVDIANVQFVGFSEIQARNIRVVPEQGDSLIAIQDLRIGVALWPLLSGKIKITTLLIEHGWLHLVKKMGVRNYDFLFRKKGATTGKQSGLTTFMDRLINQALYKVPDHLIIHDLVLTTRTDTASYSLAIQQATIEHHQLNSTLIWSEVPEKWHLGGRMQPSEKLIDLRLWADHTPLRFPLLKRKYALDLTVDTIQVALKGEELIGQDLKLNFVAGVRNLQLQQAKLADGPVLLPMLRLDGQFMLSPHTLYLDSSSTVYINALKAHPYLAFTFAPKKKYVFNFNTENSSAQTIFDALPGGLFESMQGIRVSGEMAYHLHFDLAENDPDHLGFEAGFETRQFKITHFGTENLQKINAPFLYTPYEKGKAMRPRLIGLKNPNYSPLGTISPFLKNAVVASEDPNFYSHHGIDEYAFRKVIAIDYKAKSFKRGGSTISMQLVKNAFLSRQKTIARKAEEMLITWLLENAHLTSKQRILEVYLNLIEWAPNIYGVGEASRFYFAKPPSALTLGESIFLTHIIPKPKAYPYSFNPNGSLKGYIKGYYRFLSNNLLAKGKISATDTLSMFAIHLAGPAARYVIKTPDSSYHEEDSLEIDLSARPTQKALEPLVEAPKRSFFGRLFHPKARPPLHSTDSMKRVKH